MAPKELIRLPNWRDHLTARINAMRYEPFEWGSHDCALWGGSCVKAITGVDFTKNVAGTYNDPIGAIRALKKKFNADNIKQVFTDRFDEVHIAYARPGDLVYQNSNLYGFNAVIGICYGVHSFFIHEDSNGLVEVDTITLHGAFKVG